MTTPRPPSSKTTGRDSPDPITRAFDELDEDEKLIDEVLATPADALARDLGPERVARARLRAEETRKHYEALAAKLDETSTTSTSTSTSTSAPLTLTTPLGEISAPTLRADASSPALPDSSARALPDVYAGDEPAPGSGQPHIARARGVEELEDEAGEHERKVIPLRRVLPIWLVAAALAAAAVGGGAALGLFHPRAPERTVPDQPYTAPTPEPPPDLRAAARTHRAEARALCDDGKWDECNARMVEAQGEDPAGDDAPDVKALWDRILQHQIDEAKKHPPDDDMKKGPPRR
jgi:hypothetical protein